MFVEITLRSPIFEWQGVPARFFEALREALEPHFSMNTRDFVSITGPSLGDAMARYNVLGGTSSIILFADRIRFELLNLLPADNVVVFQILGSVDKRLAAEFSNNEYSKGRYNSYDHYEIVDGNDVDDYLERYKIPLVDKIFSEIGVVNSPGARFSISANDGSFSVACALEKSFVVSNGLFVQIDLTDFRLQRGQLLARAQEWAGHFTPACMSALGLEWPDAG